jgi:flavin reductase (DIM6/NTAB) family NADH-FMN oxidoreductase RutF
MYYEPGATDHGLPFDPFKSCVVPRPIGWISTVGADGVDNLAPYSQFQNIGFDPPIVMFSANQDSAGGRKNSVVNAEASGEFVWNMATYALREAVNITSEELPLGIDEFARAGLTKSASALVAPKRVKESPIQFECKYLQTVRLPGNGKMGTVDVVFGRVVAIHIDDAAIIDGKVDVARLKPLARLGYYNYTFVETIFAMPPPGDNLRYAAGLEGSPKKAAGRWQP